MLMVPTSSALPGMVLALPVFHPQKPDHTLLKVGACLDEGTIGRLGELRVPRLWVKYPSLDFLAKYASPRIMQEHARLTARLGECFDEVTTAAHAEVDFARYSRAVQGLLESLLEDMDAAVLIHEMVDAERPALVRASNICFMSLLMGLKLDGYLIDQRRRISALRAKNIENLGAGAMLADIGMLHLEPEVIERWEATHDESDQRWREHVLIGFQMVRGKVPPTAAAAVLHHHQRYDGTGFPRKRNAEGLAVGQAGDDIHVFARIVAVADRYERLRNPAGAARDGTGTVAAVRALRGMLDLSRDGQIDPTIFKALLAVVPAYSPGNIVKLSDGSTAVVTGWDPVRPCRPRVCRMGAEPLDGPDVSLADEIDLKSQEDLSIVESEGQDVSDANFEPCLPGEFDLRVPTAPVSGESPRRCA